MMASVITTFRMARQTSRWARYAAVTVDVIPAVADAVTVADGIRGSDAMQSEASCGAHDALRRIATGGRYRVIITDIVTTDVDTSVGDVYEAAARAVWQALSIDPPLYVGFREPELVAGWLRDRIGRRLVAVTEARHWYHGERDPDPAAGLIHAWLHFDHRPPARLSGSGGDLELSTEDPYPGYELDEFGEVRVAPAGTPDVLASVVGRRLTDAAVVLGPATRPSCTGLLLRLDGVDVLIGTFCDEWVLAFDRPPVHVGPYWHTQPWIAQR